MIGVATRRLRWLPAALAISSTVAFTGPGVGVRVDSVCQPWNGAQVCTWGREAGRSVIAFGATIPVAAIQAAPADAPMHWPPVADAIVPMPPEVQQSTGFTELTIFTEPHGHPPKPYETPHFDFHFYWTAPDSVARMDCSDSTRPAALPTGYTAPDETVPGLGTLIAICVPGMGMHALPAKELQSDSAFRRTMVMGYYHGAPVFIEPMVARAMLMERHSFMLPVPEVAGLPPTLRYPSRFLAEYDAHAHAYRFTFSGLRAPAASHHVAAAGSR